MKTALLVGGLPIAQQLHRLNSNIQVRRIITATPPPPPPPQSILYDLCGILIKRRHVVVLSKSILSQIIMFNMGEEAMCHWVYI